MTTLIDLIRAPWAIMPETLAQIQSIYERHMAGEIPDFAGIEATIGKRLQNGEQGYEVMNGIATIPLHGVIGKRMNVLRQISGGASHQLFSRDVRMALEDPKVKGILLEIDSPGGTVDGTAEAAMAVRSARGVKPIVALADSTMASAAYWIGSWADQVYAGDGVTQVGSIGVIATHYDTSVAEAERGIRVTEIIAGKFKAAASQHTPLTADGKEELQRLVDGIYSQFVSSVGLARGRSAVDVQDNMANGRVFLSHDAVDRGLIDGVMPRDDVIAELRQRIKDSKRTAVAVSKPKEISVMGIFASEYDGQPVESLVAAIEQEAPQVAAVLLAKGAGAERDRIADVRKQVLPGHEKLIEQLAFDGKTTGAEAAQAVLAAERSLGNRALAAIEADAPNLTPSVSVTGETVEPEKAKNTLATARSLSDRIVQKQKEAAQVGRTLSATQALHLIRTESEV